MFPIDVWVERAMTEIYGVKGKKKIEELAKEKYGELAGLAQQYLFYWKRDSE